MAHSPKHIEVVTPSGAVRVAIRYVRPFTQTVRVRFCWATQAGIEHSCDDFGCWNTSETSEP